ncbi:MAG TPA: hypothetical protein VGQ57_04460 [Polyangiaceae bacterium]|jgi:hypothetical protein|nr:hypothetical protein [Polyangiaceae bacterium]
MRRSRARFLIVLAALLLLPGSAWARVQYLCHMSGRVQATCCCEAREKALAPSSGPAAKGDCCDRLTPAAGSPATNSRATADSIPSAALAAVVAAPIYFARGAPAPELFVRQSRAPPGATRPLFAVHCAYLC